MKWERLKEWIIHDYEHSNGLIGHRKVIDKMRELEEEE